MKPAKTILVSLLIGIGTGSVSHAQMIVCPVDSVRTEIVTPLPEPWWQTPQEGGLVTTRIDRVGGELTLTCAYLAYGRTVSVMRPAPTDLDCKAVRGGFSCRPIPKRFGPHEG